MKTNFSSFLKKYSFNFLTLLQSGMRILELQLFLTALSTPLLVGWGLPISVVSWFATPLFAPIFSAFLILSSIIFVGYFLYIPLYPFTWALHKTTQLWIWLLSFGSPRWLIGFKQPPLPFLLILPIAAFFIIHYRPFTKAWIRIVLLALAIITFCTSLKLIQYYGYPAIKTIACHNRNIYVVSDRNNTIVIDNGALATKPSNRSWLEYELLPTITKNTGKTAITTIISLQASLRTIETIQLINEHHPLHSVILPPVLSSLTTKLTEKLDELNKELAKNNRTITFVDPKKDLILKNEGNQIIISSLSRHIATQKQNTVLLKAIIETKNTKIEIMPLKKQPFLKKNNNKKEPNE